MGGISKLTTLFTDIADAIRSKNGESAQIPALSFPEKIEALEVVQIEEGSKGVYYDEDGIPHEVESAETAIVENGTPEELFNWNTEKSPVRGIVIDKEGCVCCAADSMLYKVSETGEKIWEYNAYEGSSCNGLSYIDVDSVGNIYVADSVRGPLKCSPNGELIWSSPVWYNANTFYCIHVLTDNNIFIGYDKTSGYSAYISTFDANGNDLRQNDWSAYRPYDIKSCNEDYVIVSCHDGNVLKLTPNLSEVWWYMDTRETLTGPQMNAVALDSKEYIYVAETKGITKLDLSGNFMWEYVQSGYGFESICCNSFDQIIAGASSKLKIVKITDMDNKELEYEISSDTGGYSVYDMAVDSCNNIYVTSKNSLIKLSNTSVKKGVATYTLPESSGGGTVI